MNKPFAIAFLISLLACQARSNNDKFLPQSEAQVNQPRTGSREELLSPLDSFGALQAVTVTSENWESTSAVLRTFSRNNRSEVWQKNDFEIDVSLGRNGMAWGRGLHPSPSAVKVEGDGRTPAGIFSFGIAFGYQQFVATKLNYVPMTNENWCIDDPEIPNYNQIVTTSQQSIGNSTEKMLRSDLLYKYGIFVNHNPAGEKNAGSCIFVHIWRGPGRTTAGCTAMAEENIKALLNWLDASKKPVLIAMPASEYQAKKTVWKLPIIW